MILRQKAFLEEMNHRIGKAVTALYDFAKNRDLIFSNEAEASIGNGIIALATLLLAAGGKGGVSVGGGGGGSNNELTNWDGTKKDRGRRK